MKRERGEGGLKGGGEDGVGEQFLEHEIIVYIFVA